MQSVEPEQLREMLDAGDDVPFLLDVRDPWEFEMCRIPGSCNVPMGEVVARIDELDRDRATVVVCHHGMRSAQVAGYLESLGFQAIMNLEGGIDAWARNVDNEMPQY
jgi:rhodanese-related sulfurtransferase